MRTHEPITLEDLRRVRDKLQKAGFRQPLECGPWVFTHHDDRLSEQEMIRLRAEWKKAWPEEKAPELIVLPASCDVRPGLPGRYAWHYRVDDLEQTFTFQTLEEMVKFAKEYNYG